MNRTSIAEAPEERPAECAENLEQQSDSFAVYAPFGALYTQMS